MERSIRYNFFTDLESVQHKLSSDYSLNICFSRRFPYIDGLSFSPYLLFTNWVQGPYQEIQAEGFSYSPSLRGLFGKPRACISWYGTSTQLVNSLLHDPF